MKQVENDCVGCPPEIGCLGSACPYINVIHYYCDHCGAEETLYEYDDEELCKYCLLEAVPRVKGSEK